MTGRRTAPFLVTALLAACDSGPSVAADAGADVPVAIDLPKTTVDAPMVDVAVDVPPLPYDAGPAPSCDGAPLVQSIATQTAGYSDGEVAGLVTYRGGFLALWREGALRVGVLDAAVPARDQITLLAVDPNGLPQRPAAVVRSTAGTNIDLSTPTLTRAGDGALALFRESVGTPGDSDYATRLVAAPIDDGGAAMAPITILPGYSDPIATGLSSGVTLALSARVVQVLDGGVVVASPSAVRVRPNGELAAAPVDVTALIPTSAENVVLRPDGDAAAAIYKLGSSVYVERFDQGGLIDSRGPRVTRNLLLPRIDDGAVLSDAVVIAWSEELNGQVVVSAAVLALDGTLRARRTLDQFVGVDPPSVTVVPTYGGATAMWLRTDGVLRAATVQPDGVAQAAFDGPRVVEGAGRIVAVGSGRRVSAVVQSGARGRRYVVFTRFCISTP